MPHTQYSHTSTHAACTQTTLHKGTELTWPVAALWGDNTHLVEFDDVGVVQQFHNLNLSVNFLQVRRVQSGLVDDLDGHLQYAVTAIGREVNSKCRRQTMGCHRRRPAADLRFGDFVPSEFHHCKISLAQGADDLIEADLQGPSLARSGLSCLAAL